MKKRTLFILFISIIIVFIALYRTECLRICFLSKFIVQSYQYTTFYDWSQFCQSHLRTCHIGHIYPPPSNKKPYIILLNHIKSHVLLGSFLSAALVVGQTPCKIVCYANYCKFAPRPVSTIMNSILQDELRIDKYMSKIEKEQSLTKQIRNALSQNQNVVMFIESHKGNTVLIRSFYKAVLNHFPRVYKQYYHLLEPEGVNGFRCQNYPATLHVEDILNIRRSICVH